MRIAARTPSPGNFAKRASVLAGLILLGVCGLAFGQVEEKDSIDFDWQYEMDVLPSLLDLDHNGSPDFSLSGSSITTDGDVLTLPPNQCVESFGSGVWPNKFNFATGYTVEARVKAVSQVVGNGAFALYSSASDASRAGILKVGTQDQGWGRTASDLGVNDNTDVFHVFRVTQAPGANCFSVWRDDVFLATNLTHVYTLPNRFWFGDGTSLWEGSSQVDYVRFTAGAYTPVGSPLPPPPPPPFPGTIVSVDKQLYLESPPEGAAYLSQYYVGPGRERMEIQGIEEADDVLRQRQFRLSTDNGSTWSGFQSLPSNDVSYQGIPFWEGDAAKQYDPTSGRLVDVWLRQVAVGSVYHNFTYYRLSTDMGQTWSEPEQLCYESGAQFNPANPLDPDYLNHNEGYLGNNILVRSDGKLMHVVGAANDPNDPLNDSRPWRMGSVCFTGTWDPVGEDYVWTASETMAISPDWSSRGLMEPEVAELDDGRIAVVWRTSNTATMPGRKFYSVSTDGGLTFTDPAVWQYDDGSDFYSPSSYHRMLRHSLTGKLYWIGNISLTEPSGNSPRYPLVIAEVDEDNFSLKKDSVTIIDTRNPDDPAIALSNFSVLENCETHAFELYMTRVGDPAGNDVYKYTLTLAELADLIQGDLNLDGFVGGDDLDIVRLHWGENVRAGYWSLGDANGDGLVGGDDLDVVRLHWGEGTPPAPGVPEPSVLAMFSGGALLLLVTRGCRRRRRVVRRRCGC